jgi:hypothetical protein
MRHGGKVSVGKESGIGEAHVVYKRPLPSALFLPPSSCLSFCYRLPDTEVFYRPSFFMMDDYGITSSTCEQCWDSVQDVAFVVVPYVCDGSCRYTFLA